MSQIIIVKTECKKCSNMRVIYKEGICKNCYVGENPTYSSQNQNKGAGKQTNANSDRSTCNRCNK